MKGDVVIAFLWQGGVKIFTQIISFVISIILARLLTPDDYGLIGMAIIYISFLDLVNEFGIGSSIIQKQDLPEKILSSLNWFALWLGLIFMVLTIATSSLVASFFSQPRLKNIISVLSVLFVISALKNIPFNILTRNLEFKKRSIAEMTSIFSGGAVAITAALNGFGVWSLVGNTICQGIILTGMILYFSSWKPSFHFCFSEIKEVLSFGSKLLLTRIQWFVYSKSDSLIIGKMLGDKSLGIYSLALSLALLPTEKISSVINQVAFPFFSSIQDDETKLQDMFLFITKGLALFSFPLLTLLFVLADILIPAIYTSKWVPMIPILRMLCIVGLLKSIDVVIPQILVARGKANKLVKYSSLMLIVMPIAFLCGSLYGLSGIATAWILCYPLLSLFLYRICFCEIHLKPKRYISQLLPFALSSIFMGISVWFISIWITDLVFNVTLRLTFLSLLGFVQYLLCLWAYDKETLTRLIAFVKTRTV
jgi:O-antigen/teichoic acid export membrane protein